MNVISVYKKKFRDANKRLVEDETALCEAKKKMADIQKEIKRLEENVVVSRQNKVEEGLHYYNESMRKGLLEEAARLPYSKQTIQRLSSIENSQWDSDNIDIDTIGDFEALEQYINKHTLTWERSPLTKIGKWFNQSLEE